jgi:hypothetical protein
MAAEDNAKLVATAQALLDSAQMTAAASQKLLLVTAQSLRVVLFLMKSGNFGELSPDTMGDVVNVMARVDNALGANTAVGK